MSTSGSCVASSASSSGERYLLWVSCEECE